MGPIDSLMERAPLHSGLAQVPEGGPPIGLAPKMVCAFAWGSGMQETIARVRFSIPRAHAYIELHGRTIESLHVLGTGPSW